MRVMFDVCFNVLTAKRHECVGAINIAVEIRIEKLVNLGRK